jgi:hypothetical protein
MGYSNRVSSVTRNKGVSYKVNELNLIPPIFWPINTVLKPLKSVMEAGMARSVQ